MKKKLVLIGSVAAFIMLGCCIFISSKDNSSKDILSLNAEAIASHNIPQIPCIPGGKKCEYQVKDANGEIYDAETSGMTHE